MISTMRRSRIFVLTVEDLIMRVGSASLQLTRHYNGGLVKGFSWQELLRQRRVESRRDERQ